MSWEWSHSAEAYDAVETNIRSQPREWLEIVYAEWRASQGKGGAFTDQFDERKYGRALAFAKREDVSDELLMESIIGWTNELRTCTNGGWMAHCCPFGCHMVPFDAVNPETGE